MSRPRLIACILLKHGLIVRSQLFQIHQVIGSPISTIHRLSNWNVDELVLLDISEDDYHDMRRDDMAMRYTGTSTIEILQQISDVCFMPLAFGGRIKSIADMQVRLAAGADKCVINTEAVANNALITEGAKRFGSQCIVVSIDAMRHENGSLEVLTEGGKRPTGLHPADWARRAEELGAGEIFLNSIDRDGAGWGYDIDLIREVAEATSIPVIACGGVGKYEHFPAGILEGGASAVAAANIFNFYELAYPYGKKACIDAGIPMRAVGLNSRWFPREPTYDLEKEKARLEERLDRAAKDLGPKTVVKSRHSVKWCRKCLYPSISATPMEFDEKGVCMGCRTDEMKRKFPQKEWDRRKQILIDTIEENRRRFNSDYDCIVAVGGGKDSYFQAHYIKEELGYKPLLVTYYGNNFSPAGERNLRRMKEALNLDHIIVFPNVELLKKLNRLGFVIMGDMNWHNHLGGSTIVHQIAVEKRIPIVIWGEHGYADLCGQFSMNDFVEYTYRNRLEHLGRGYEWTYFVGHEGITEDDMVHWKYPSDEEIFELGLRGLYLGNYIYWDANEHTKLIIEKYGWELADEPFERTYRMMSNLDDIYENGAHDWLKFVKFGYGRCTDHASKDIRGGILGRGQAIDLVKRYDPVKPSDIRHWCDYVGMDPGEFDRIADTFRDPRVWRRENGEWVKTNLWENPEFMQGVEED